MAEKERRLGKGLEALITSARNRTLNLELVQRAGHRVQSVPLDAVVPNPFQPRTEFSVDELNELVESLRNHGLLQPIVVRRDGEQFQLVAGERRWRAARELGWTALEAVVVEADERQMLEWALVENIQRQALGPLELAKAYREMILKYGLTQDELARALGMSRPSVANHLRLLDLPTSVQARVARGTLSLGAAKVLCGLTDPLEQEGFAEKIELGKASVRQLEEWLRKQPRAPAVAAERSRQDPNVHALGGELQDALGTRVAIRGSMQRGRIVIQYRSARELDALVRRFTGGRYEPRGTESDEGDALTV